MLEEIIKLAQQRGFFFKSADSYPNTPAGFWDYGPVGLALKNKFIELWRRLLVKKDGMIEIDGSQILPKAVFIASGHLNSFNDPMVKCNKCGALFRPDRLIEEKASRQVPERLSNEEYDDMLQRFDVRCPNCNSGLSGTSRFNMMFKLEVGGSKEEAYLRPETCQTIFVDFPLLYKTQRIKLPIGIAQVGKSFRNEIAPRQGLLRLREINQAEIEVFFDPEKIEGKKFELYVERKLNLHEKNTKTLSYENAKSENLVSNKLEWYYLCLMEDLYLFSGISKEDIRFRILTDEERAFYSSAAYDLEVKLSVGWTELVACNYRSNYDLKRHSEISGTDFTVEIDGKKIIPHVFELSMGIDRSIYSILEKSYTQDGNRRYLRLKPYLAPYQTGIFPLVNKDGIDEFAYGIYKDLINNFDCFFDDSGSIGKRYARADEIGVPFCITVDYETLNDNTVTIRDRDTKGQLRIGVAELSKRLQKMTSYPSIELP